MRGHTQVLDALRETQLEQGGVLREVAGQVRRIADRLGGEDLG
ncbi:hypothetical protein [Streptomyces hoynatensis]|nr:hypothetical protein [Streptomyces hoynatensis]